MPGYESENDYINKASALGQKENLPYFKFGTAAEAAGIWQSLWYTQGCPGIPGHPARGATPGTALVSKPGSIIEGSIYYPDQVGLKKMLLTYEGSPGQDASVVLYDRLYECPFSLSLTGAQNINPAAAVALPRYADGRGVTGWVEMWTTTGSPTITAVGYTNELGVAGRVGSVTLAGTPVIGSMYPIALQSGDLGIRSVQTVTVGTAVAGAAATGTITAVAGNLLVDGETFTVSDGFNIPTVFEFDSNAAVTAGRVAVPFTSGDSSATVAAAILAAINGVGNALRVTASSGGGAVTNLVNDFKGTHGNVTITDTVANVGFSSTGMSTGTASANANVVLLHDFLTIPGGANHWVPIDTINDYHALEQVYDGAALAMKYLATTTTALAMYGHVQLGWG